MVALLNTLAYVGMDQRIYAHDLDGGQRVHLTHGLRSQSGGAVAFDWPVWSPDAGRVAFAAESGEDSGLFVVNADGSNARRLSEGDRPFCIGWSRDGRRIAYLAQAGGGLVTVSVSVDGAPGPSRVVTGQPCYLDWSPGGEDLLVHVGGGVERNQDAYVARVGVTDGVRRPLGAQPGEFRAASWSPDGGRILTSSHSAEGDAVAVLGDAGGERVLARYRGKAAFLWSPTGAHVAMLHSQEMGSPAYEQGLHLVDADGGERRVLSAQETIAFSWSPDGTRIASWEVDRHRGRLSLVCVNTDGTGRKHVASLAPSQSHLMVLTFFDQYALAFSFWSPDGRHLTFAGRAFKEQANGTATPDQDAIYVVTADGSEQPRNIGPGSLAVFPRVIASANMASGA